MFRALFGRQDGLLKISVFNKWWNGLDYKGQCGGCIAENQHGGLL